jgi:prefoldin subunit 5
MNKTEINQKIEELKMEYVKLQGDIEKLESTGHSIKKSLEKLSEIENELKSYRSLLSI